MMRSSRLSPSLLPRVKGHAITMLEGESLEIEAACNYASVFSATCVGEPQTFTLSVKPSRNYPLDMYFLMDLSGSQFADLEMLRNLSTSICEV